MKILNIIESGYRGTVEEQDDTILWLSQSMQAAGAEIDVLLRGNAVNYALEAQKSLPVSFGNWTQQHPPEVVTQVRSLIKKGAEVYASAADINNRGILHDRLLASVTLLADADISRLFDRYDRVLAW